MCAQTTRLRKLDARRDDAAHLEETNRLSDRDQAASILESAFVRTTKLRARRQMVWLDDLSSLYVFIMTLDVFGNHVFVSSTYLKIDYSNKIRDFRIRVRDRLDFDEVALALLLADFARLSLSTCRYALARRKQANNIESRRERAARNKQNKSRRMRVAPTSGNAPDMCLWNCDGCGRCCLSVVKVCCV